MQSAMAGLIVCAATAAWANTGHHDVGGGGGGEPACIRWEPIPVDMAGRDMTVADMAGGVAGRDMAGADLAGRDMAGADLAGGGAGVAHDMAIGVRCAERASLFGCAFVPSAADGGDGAALALLGAIVVFDVVRARRRRRHG